MTGSLVVAHAGHVVLDAGLYGGPIVVLLGALAVSTARARRS